MNSRVLLSLLQATGVVLVLSLLQATGVVALSGDEKLVLSLLRATGVVLMGQLGNRDSVGRGRPQKCDNVYLIDSTSGTGTSVERLYFGKKRPSCKENTQSLLLTMLTCYVPDEDDQ